MTTLEARTAVYTRHSRALHDPAPDEAAIRGALAMMEHLAQGTDRVARLAAKVLEDRRAA